MNALETLFQDKLLVDDRDPVVSVEFGDWNVDLLPPKYTFYLQVIFVRKLS